MKHKTLVNLSLILLSGAFISGCGGSTSTLPPLMNYKTTDISNRVGGLNPPRVRFSGNIVNGFGSIYFINGTALEGIPPFQSGPLPVNTNIPESAERDIAVPTLVRRTGEFIGGQSAVSRDAVGLLRAIYLGFACQWETETSVPVPLRNPDFRLPPEGVVPGTSDPFVVEGATPIQLTSSDYLLVRSDSGFPAPFYRQNLQTSEIELIGTGLGQNRNGIIGEGGQVVITAATGSGPSLYFAVPGANGVPCNELGTQYPRIILPDGTVVGDSFDGILNNKWWYFKPDTGFKLIEATGKANMNITGASANGTMVGWYRDVIANRDVAWVSNELGNFVPLEELANGPDLFVRAYGINAEGRILAARLGPSGEFILCVLDATIQQ